MSCFKFKGVLAASIGLALSMVFQVHAQGAETIGDFSTRVNVSSFSADTTYDRFIISYRDNASRTSIAMAQSASAAMTRAVGLQSSLSAARPQVNYKRQLATGAHLVRTSRKLTQAEAAAFMQSIASDPAVAYVEPDVLWRAIGMQAPAISTPNDVYFARYQTDYLPGDGTATPANALPNWGGVNITGAWGLADGTGVTIAVLDSGIVKHDDVDTSLGDAGYDFIDSSFVSGRPDDGRAAGGWDLGDWTTGEPYTIDGVTCEIPSMRPEKSSWHGTHVASASGAERTNNGVGMAGIAYGARILPVRVLGHCGGYTSDIADGIVWASGGHVDGVPDNKHPAQVINMSLGGAGICMANSITAKAVATARSNGASVVVAAGNNGANVANYSPASCPGVITVASTGVGSGLAYYSNYNIPGGNIVKLAAFGGGVYANDGSSGSVLNPEGFAWQAVNSGETTPVDSPKGDTYGGMSGTSQAAPHVAGAVALMQSARLAASLPLLTPDDVLSILQRTASQPHTTPNSAKTFGAGILDAGAAAAAAVNVAPQTAIALQNGVILTNQGGATGSETFYVIDVPAGARALVMGTAGGTGDVSLYVKAGALPTSTSYDASSVHAGNAESVTVPRVPIATTYYLRVVGLQAYQGVSVQAIYTP